ncbi:hypothetical protein KUTeg_011435 [Tegillarca granosa]|uniref:B box-type domain-containing protein n=1 Tax=Tegillarca granosa TaxID=220873 RepID=A0ABQ9F472_TEGGR|nr:hypothetical protein KUTeg_011435 [Tegillarca granosa]
MASFIKKQKKSFEMAQEDQIAAHFQVYHEQKCELCETNNFMFQCVNCDELMCETCQKSHLKSKASKNHKTVCIKSSEMYKINQTGKKCQSHTEKDLLMYCNTCNCPICRECIAIGVHPNHSMVKVEEVIDTKQQQLSNIIRQTNERSERYKDILNTITRNKMQFSESIAETIKEIKARNRQLKIRLDKIESEYIQQLENKDKENKEAMTELEKRLKEEMSDLNQLIQQCEIIQTERNIEMVQFVTEVMQRVEKYTLCDQPDDISPPNLITRDVDDQELKDLFGRLDIKTQPDVTQPLIQLNRSVPSAIPAIERVDKYTLCDQPDDISTPNLITRYVDDQELEDLLEHIDMKTKPEYKLSKIVEITTSGQHIRTIQCDPVDKKQLFDHPRFICTNINGDIIVTDNDCKVVAINKQGQKKFIYQAEGRQLKQSFLPHYLVTDKHGHIMISDFNNSVLHVLDRDGKFIQYLITPQHGCDRPIGMDLDNHGRLWVGNSGKKKIDIIKYLTVVDIRDHLLAKIVEMTTSGQHIRTIHRDTVDHKELFTYPLFVCSNINGDIIVTDDDKVVAVNKEGTIRFIYQAEGRQLKQSFYPQYIVTDKQGRMFINDYQNSVIHVLDSDGKFIQYLITPEQGCDRPIGLDLDNHGRLWIFIQIHSQS